MCYKENENTFYKWRNKKQYGYENYKDHVQQLNIHRITELSGKITSELIPLLSGTISSFNSSTRVIVTTWSDGRLENLPNSSDLELIVYWENLSNDLEKIVSSVFSTELSSIPGVSLHASEVEAFDLLKYKLIQYSWNEQVFPTRFLDSKYLWWNYELYKQLWSRFVKELRNSKSSELQRFYKKIAYHKKILLHGKVKFKGKDIVYYDEDKKIVNLYNKSGHDTVFKQGALRTYQYVLARLIFKFIRRSNLTNQDINDLINLPKTIASKLEYIRDEIKNINQYEEHLREIKDTYYYFLNLHNFSKKSFKHEDISIYLSSEEFKLLKDRIKFIKNTLVKWELKEHK